MKNALVRSNRVILLCLAAGMTFVGGCGDEASDGGHAGGWIEDDFAAAAESSVTSGRPVLLDLYADWCGPCRTLATSYFPDPSMSSTLSSFVLARADVDGSEGSRLAEIYGVSSIPCVLILAPDGTEYGRITGVMPAVADYKAELERILAGI